MNDLTDKRGGRRKGAGRHLLSPEKRMQIHTVTLRPRDVCYLLSVVPDNLSAAIRQITDEHQESARNDVKSRKEKLNAVSGMR